MDDVVGVAAVLYISKEEDRGSLIIAAPKGRTTIGLTMRRTWWWMLPTHCPTTRAGEVATTTMTTMGKGGDKMDDVIKVAALLDKTDESGSGFNNNVHYDGVDGHRGGDIGGDYNGQGEYGSGNFASAFFCESLSSLAVARKLSVQEVDNFSQ
jgi:hypothetical protein